MRDEITVGAVILGLVLIMIMAGYTLAFVLAHTVNFLMGG